MRKEREEKGRKDVYTSYTEVWNLTCTEVCNLTYTEVWNLRSNHHHTEVDTWEAEEALSECVLLTRRPQRHGLRQNLPLVRVRMLAETSNCSFLLLDEQPENAPHREPLREPASLHAVCSKHAEAPDCRIAGYCPFKGSVTHQIPDFLYVPLCVCPFLILLLPQSSF